ncbi:unnamed protein product [Discosporangium mesarthrocarpum]
MVSSSSNPYVLGTQHKDFKEKSSSLDPATAVVKPHGVGPSPDAVALLKAEARKRNSGEPEFLQAVDEVLEDLAPVFKKRPDLVPIMMQLLEPERVIIFRVPWLDDAGNVQVNRGYRVQLSSALGPYKGGLRFHPDVNLSVLKFLAFEQVLKNALTGLPLGAGKGGSDFEPKGKSLAETQRFCQSFMTELFKHIGSHTDVPAGDIGVGEIEIGYLFGQYKRLKGGLYEGALTGKPLSLNGSYFRPEATGFGVVYFARQAIEKTLLSDIQRGAGGGAGEGGGRCAVSGSGNVALHCGLKLVEFGASVLTFSDSSGFVVEPKGFTAKQISALRTLKASNKQARVSAYLKLSAASATARFFQGERPWAYGPFNLAFPCATQNELDESDAHALVIGGCRGVFEGANMPCTAEAVEELEAEGVLYGPGKACNAGGVAVSCLEMVQNASLLRWKPEQVNQELRTIMEGIHYRASRAAEEWGHIKGGSESGLVEHAGAPLTLKAGANIAGFLTVAEAMQCLGAV